MLYTTIRCVKCKKRISVPRPRAHSSKKFPYQCGDCSFKEAFPNYKPKKR